METLFACYSWNWHNFIKIEISRVREGFAVVCWFDAVVVVEEDNGANSDG